MPFTFQKLSPGPGEQIAEAVFAQLRKGIARHEIPPGFHLSVPSLAAQFGVSRSPVHEAVVRLVQEGLAAKEPHRGAFVAEYNSPSLVSLYEVRCALEALAAGLAAERAGAQAIKRIENLLEDEAAAIAHDDIERHIDIDIQFHRLLLECAANPALDEMLSKIYERIRVAMIARVVTGGPAQALADHKAIYEAIAQRDSALADQRARAHVMRIYTQLIAQRSMQRDQASASHGGAVGTAPSRPGPRQP
jgi:DNA-binding GntR family transcriptional regulator